LAYVLDDLQIVMFVVQVGDGTTTVVLLAGEFLKEAKPFIEDGVHPQNLIRSYRTASYLVHDLIFFPK
jgi:T-complex protein 1 subunit eta